jgi:plasmid maintenance system antidote protein VapI
MQISPRRINEIVHAKRNITADIDLRLSRELGTSEGFWMGLQTDEDIEILKTRRKAMSHTMNVLTQPYQTFESIRQQDRNHSEYWLARRLAKVLEYSEYRHFLPVIERAKEACRHSGHSIEDHFEDILEMVDIGSGAKRSLADVRLSR